MRTNAIEMEYDELDFYMECNHMIASMNELEKDIHDDRIRESVLYGEAASGFAKKVWDGLLKLLKWVGGMFGKMWGFMIKLFTGKLFKKETITLPDVKKDIEDIKKSAGFSKAGIVTPEKVKEATETLVKDSPEAKKIVETVTEEIKLVEENVVKVAKVESEVAKISVPATKDAEVKKKTSAISKVVKWDMIMEGAVADDLKKLKTITKVNDTFSGQLRDILKLKKQLIKEIPAITNLIKNFDAKNHMDLDAKLSKYSALFGETGRGGDSKNYILRTGKKLIAQNNEMFDQYISESKSAGSINVHTFDACFGANDQAYIMDCLGKSANISLDTLECMILPLKMYKLYTSDRDMTAMKKTTDEFIAVLNDFVKSNSGNENMGNIVAKIQTILNNLNLFVIGTFNTVNLGYKVAYNGIKAIDRIKAKYYAIATVVDEAKK